MNCITIQHCIVRQWAGEKAVSRYNYCIVTEAGQALDVGLGSRCARRGAGGQASVLGRAGEQQLGAGWARRARAERAGGRAEWAARRAGVGSSGRAGAQASGGRAVQGRQGAGLAAWPWAVHSVHSACFWTRFDSVFS